LNSQSCTTNEGGLSKYRVEFQVSTQYTGEDQRLLRENPNWAKTLGGERIHYIFHTGNMH